jgi:hypothetical protein
MSYLNGVAGAMGEEAADHDGGLILRGHAEWGSTAEVERGSTLRVANVHVC